MSDPKVHILKQTELAHARGTLTQVDYEFRTFGGGMKKHRREVYDNGHSAAVLPYDPDRGTVLLARQLRLPPFLKDGRETMLEACAGKLDGEEPAKRMVMEIEEELGYRITRLDRLFDLYMTPAAVAEKITFFRARYSPADRINDGGGLADEGEDIEVVEMPFDEAFAMIAGGEIVDAKTVILLQALRLELAAT